MHVAAQSERLPLHLFPKSDIKAMSGLPDQALQLRHAANPSVGRRGHEPLLGMRPSSHTPPQRKGVRGAQARREKAAARKAAEAAALASGMRCVPRHPEFLPRSPVAG